MFFNNLQIPIKVTYRDSLGNGSGIPGKSFQLSLRRQSDSLKYDFSDNTFKTTPVQEFLTLPDLGGGLYLHMLAITNITPGVYIYNITEATDLIDSSDIFIVYEDGTLEIQNKMFKETKIITTVDSNNVTIQFKDAQANNTGKIDANLAGVTETYTYDDQGN